MFFSLNDHLQAPQQKVESFANRSLHTHVRGGAADFTLETQDHFLYSVRKQGVINKVINNIVFILSTFILLLFFISP